MKHRAFTLFEVIIVLVIIVGIAALVFPLFARSRETVRPRDYCQSNLKQIALGFKQYVQDYDEKYPPASVVWPAAAQPYLKSWWIFQCPLDTLGATDKTSDYFFNAGLLGANAKTIAAPALTILAGDGLSDQLSPNLPQLPASWIFDQSSPAHRHKDDANYAFADGHVKRFGAAQITLQNPSQGQPTFEVKP